MARTRRRRCPLRPAAPPDFLAARAVQLECPRRIGTRSSSRPPHRLLLYSAAEPSRPVALTALLPQLAPLSLSAASRQTQRPSATHKHSRSLTFPSPPSVGPQEQKPSRHGQIRPQTKSARTPLPFPDLPRHKLLHTSPVPFCSFAKPLRHCLEPPAKFPFVPKTLNVDSLAQPSSSPTCCAVSLLHAPCCSPARWFAFSCTVAPLPRRPEAADAIAHCPSSLLLVGPIQHRS